MGLVPKIQRRVYIFGGMGWGRIERKNMPMGIRPPAP
jgi:hypothetical protein